MQNLMSKFNPTSIKLNMFFLFLCSVVTGLPTTKAPPLTLSKMGKRETGWRGGLYTLWVEAHTQWPFSHRRDWPGGALKEIDEEGVMEVEASEDFLYIMFNPSRQILFIFYRCQIHNMFSPCAVQKVNLKHEKCHTLPHQSLCMSNKPTLFWCHNIEYVCIWINPKLLRFSWWKSIYVNASSSTNHPP